MMDRDDTQADAKALCRELDAVRSRLVSVRKRPNGGRIAIEAYALCKKIERLCHDATLCSDEREAKELIAKATTQLDELQTLLGTH